MCGGKYPLLAPKLGDVTAAETVRIVVEPVGLRLRVLTRTPWLSSCWETYLPMSLNAPVTTASGCFILCDSTLRQDNGVIGHSERLLLRLLTLHDALAEAVLVDEEAGLAQPGAPFPAGRPSSWALFTHLYWAANAS